MDNVVNGMTDPVNAHYNFRFDQLEKKLDKTNDSIERLVDVVLIGNGKPALTHRIEKIEVAMEEQTNKRDEQHRERRAIWTALAILFITAALPKIIIAIKAMVVFLAG